MTRLLVLAALAVVLWMFLEAGWARLKRMKPPEVTLVRCSGCGVHVPGERVVAGRCERCRS
ncbi:MAG: hypothetical protein ACJ76J_01725 [Thermoanaerobaculia bacterium]